MAPFRESGRSRHLYGTANQPLTLQVLDGGRARPGADAELVFRHAGGNVKLHRLP